MALTRTAAQLVSDVRNRADHIVGSFRSDATLRRYLSESCRSLVSMLVDEADEMYWANSTTVTTTANQQTSTFPTAAWKAIMLRTTIGSRRDRIPKASVDEIDIEAQSVGGWNVGCWPKYRLIGRQIYWTPMPRAAHEVALFYVPTTIFYNTGGTPIAEFSADTDYFDGVFGWEQVVVLDAAIKLVHDERKDASHLVQEWADRYAEVLTSARNQHGTEAPKVRLTKNYDGGC